MAVREKTPFIYNETYFITFTILGWERIFYNDRYCNLIYKWFDYMKSEYNNQVYAYVIMPNHVHVILNISDKSKNLSVLVFNAKRFIGISILKYLREDKKIELIKHFNSGRDRRARHKFFEPRYDSLLIQSEKFFLEKLNYIHNNPCQERWQLSEIPEDYKYSSAANYILGKGHYDGVDIVDF